MAIYAEKDGLLYACLARIGVRWRKCGQCVRGRIYSWSKTCKVCKAKIVKR